MSRYDDVDNVISAEPGDAGWLAVYVVNKPGKAPVCNVFLHETRAQARGHITRGLRDIPVHHRQYVQAFARPLLTPAMFGSLPEPSPQPRRPF